MLDGTTGTNPGIKSALLNMGTADGIQSFATRLKEDFPALDTVIHNAGIMCNEKAKEDNVSDAEANLATNLLGPIRLTAALLPVLLKQPKAAILFCTQSLRFQLKQTHVQVIELVTRTCRQG